MTNKHIRTLLICCWVFVIGICALLFHIAFSSLPEKNEPIVCGNRIMNNTAKKRNDSNFADGKAIFNNNCASCHNPVKDATGPALADIISFRSQEWICKFLTDPKFIPNDKRATNFRKQYGLSCMKFPQLDCREVQAVVKYDQY